MGKNYMKILIPVAAVSTLIFLFLCACTIRVKSQSNVSAASGQDIGIVRENEDASDIALAESVAGEETIDNDALDNEVADEVTDEATDETADESTVDEEAVDDATDESVTDEEVEDNDENSDVDSTEAIDTEETDTANADMASGIDKHSGSYIIYVNRDQNVVRVNRIDASGKETPEKVFTCSCGRLGHATPKGTFKMSDKYDWRLMVDGTYARYCVRFNGKILFHSVPYYTQAEDNLEWEQYNMLGQNASLGCVRLAVMDAKWIYDNCPKGTTVVVYTDEEDPTPLVKPETIFISPMSANRGWDPTDDSPFNPWNIMQ